MADPSQLLAKSPWHAGQLPSLLTEDSSTIFESELTADTSPGRYAHSHDVDGENNTADHEGYVSITGFGVDYTNSDDLTFPGFRPMRHYLTAEAADYLVSERRWSNQGDSVDTVGQKNVIVLFVCFVTIEECLVDEKSQSLLPAIGPFDDLMDRLGIRRSPSNSRRSYKFLLAIRNAFVRSRSGEIKYHLENGKGSPPEPSDLPGLGRMLLDVMDKHIAFLLTKRPLTRLCVPRPSHKVLRLRLIQVEKQLRNKGCIEECFTTFVPTIPAHQQMPWPRCGMAAAWEAAHAKLTAKQTNPAVEPNPNNQPELDQPVRPEASMDTQIPIPGIPAPASSLPSGPDSTIGHRDGEHPDAFSGLKIFKTAVCQVHKNIRSTRDSINSRNFIDQIQHDIEYFYSILKLEPALPMTESARTTGILGSELEVLLERKHILPLMNVGLGVIRHQWHGEYLTDDLRQKILFDIMEELRDIKTIAGQVSSDKD